MFEVGKSSRDRKVQEMCKWLKTLVPVLMVGALSILCIMSIGCGKSAKPVDNGTPVVVPVTPTVTGLKSFTSIPMDALEAASYESFDGFPLQIRGSQNDQGACINFVVLGKQQSEDFSMGKAYIQYVAYDPNKDVELVTISDDTTSLVITRVVRYRNLHITFGYCMQSWTDMVMSTLKSNAP